MPSYTLHHSGYKAEDFEVESASSNYLHLRDGRKLLDVGFGAGSQILGYSPPTVVEAIKKQSKNGVLFLNNNRQINILAEQLLSCLPKPLKHFVFCNSGSEATQRAIRYARAATNKNKIACFAGGWHGMNEWTLMDDGGRFDNPKPNLPSGIPDDILKHSLLLPYNDDKVFELLKENKDQLAAICVEPTQGSNPREDIVPFLKKVEEFCKSNGIIVIYDEIITGFRLSLGGASTAWQLEPDIVTYGKILGGGLPVGLVAFSHEVASNTFLDSSKQMLSGGTFSANPLVAATASSVLECLHKEDYDSLNYNAECFRNHTNNKLKSLDIPSYLMGAGSISRVVFTDKPIRNRAERDKFEAHYLVQQRFRDSMLKREILWPKNGIIFTSFVCTKAHLEYLSDSIVASLAEVLRDRND
tara:strand:- start:15022 stop:16263 length:1242 start_codon:yes stop_codon:yes gene_type:complete